MLAALVRRYFANSRETESASLLGILEGYVRNSTDFRRVRSISPCHERPSKLPSFRCILESMMRESLSICGVHANSPERAKRHGPINDERPLDRSLLFSPIIGFVPTRMRVRRSVEGILSESGCILPLFLFFPPFSLPLSFSAAIPHSPGGGQCLGGGHISSTLGGGRGGRSKKSYRAKTIISAR